MRNLLIFVIFVCVVAFYMAYKDNVAWQEFKAAYNCSVVGKTEAQTTIVPVYTGKSMIMSTVVIPSKTHWLCDDGEVHIR